MKSIELPVEAMLPRILLAREFELCATTEKTKGRVSYSYEIGFYLGGSGKLCVNGKEYAINYGDVRFTRPGTHLDSTPSYKCYTINFDFGENSTIYRNQILDNIPEYFNTTGELAKQFETVIKCFTSNEVHSKLRANAALMHIIYAVFDTFYSKKKYCDAVRRCIAYIEKNYADKVLLKGWERFQDILICTQCAFLNTIQEERLTSGSQKYGSTVRRSFFPTETRI